MYEVWVRAPANGQVGFTVEPISAMRHTAKIHFLYYTKSCNPNLEVFPPTPCTCLVSNPTLRWHAINTYKLGPVNLTFRNGLPLLRHHRISQTLPELKIESTVQNLVGVAPGLAAASDVM